MASPYSPVQVAWKLVEIASKKNMVITPHKLQKLIYIAHGFCLAVYGRALISSPVGAWMYGPILPKVYVEFKKFRNNEIELSGDENFLVMSREEDELLGIVMDCCGSLTGICLSKMTNAKNSPWYQVWHEGSNPATKWTIPDNIIKSYYKGLLDGGSPLFENIGSKSPS